MKKFLKRLFLLAMAVCLSLLLLEGMLTAYAKIRYGTIDVAELQSRDIGNEYVTALDLPEGYASTLYPHPYLSNVMTHNIEGKDPKHTIRRLNNVGLNGRDFPLKKDPSKFTILLTGGSVANHLGIAGENGSSYLEAILNDQYDFGREVVVLNGAADSWKQPQQAIMELLYGEIADAVITLDGANEGTKRLTWPVRLEYPANNFHVVNPVVQHGYENLAVSWQVNQVDQFVRNHGWRTVYFLGRGLRNWLQGSVASNESRESLESLMALPEEWTVDERFAFNIEQYKKYIREMNALANVHGAKGAYFIQPCPAIGKTLTPEEVAKVGDLGYRDGYQRMTDELLTLNKEGLPVVSLLDVFADTKETIYGDNIHPKFDGNPKYTHDVNFGPSEGNRIMSAAIAKHVAELWKVPAKASP